MVEQQVLIPAAGRGTRLLPATTEQPKEMLPLFANQHGTLRVVPTLHLIFDQLFQFGFRKFCFVVGRDKRVVEDYFTPPSSSLRTESHGEFKDLSPMNDFYKRVEASDIAWVNQLQPLGFGHAVLTGESAMRGEGFLVHAGDTLVHSRNASHLIRMTLAHNRTDADATILLKRINNPYQYGVAEVEHEHHDIIVRSVVEKPKTPKSNLAIMPVYRFEDTIFDALRRTKKGFGGELQLTDGIQTLIDEGKKVAAVELRENEARFDIGTPETYWEALKGTFKICHQETS
jgi:UTP--glucose-1-phosphate uridylyltransferase